MEVEGIREERLEHLIAFIASLTGSQKLLTQTALDFQSLGIAKKHHIEEAIDQAEDLGDVLEIMIKLLKKVTGDLFCSCPDQYEDGK